MEIEIAENLSAEPTPEVIDPHSAEITFARTRRQQEDSSGVQTHSSDPLPRTTQAPEKDHVRPLDLEAQKPVAPRVRKNILGRFMAVHRGETDRVYEKHMERQQAPDPQVTQWDPRAFKPKSLPMPPTVRMHTPAEEEQAKQKGKRCRDDD